MITSDSEADVRETGVLSSPVRVVVAEWIAEVHRDGYRGQMQVGSGISSTKVISVETPDAMTRLGTANHVY